MKKAEAIIKANEAVEGYNTVTGFSLVTGAYSSNQGFFFIQLKEWAHRTTPQTHANGVVAALNRAFAQQIPEATAVAFGPPAIPGLGTGAGFTMQLQDRSGGSPEFLAEQAARFIEAARKRPEIGRVSTLYRASVPQVYADVDRSKVLKVGRHDLRRQHDARGAARQLLRERLQPVRPRVQGVRPGRARVPAGPEAAGALLRAQRQGRDGPPRHADLHPAHVRPGVHEPLQPVPLRRDQRRARARLLLGPGPHRPRRDGEGGPAAGDGLRVGGHVVPGEERPRGGRGVRPRHPARLPDPGRAVRELGAALQRAPRHPVRRVRRLPRPVDRPPVLGELRQQHLRADRAHHADRPRREERDPDRRVRPDAPASRARGSSRRRSRRRSCASGRS